MSAFPARGFSSMGASTTGQSPALVARVNEKKAELENLKELRDLSAAMATQMEALAQKLATLSDGTEAIALVLSNWHNVLRAINMASAKLPKPSAGVQEPSEGDLPQTLVRIPTEHAPALQAHAEGAAEEE
ncbi:DASH complex subunit Dad2-domain-containing protein [Neurospora hispaniola]|uniref:DASH complex subunit DAD2 n=1 Tax=Neurospora hispaniola TaxID=588809 RepID=A0AAJ0I5T3_9PEZI|nr:DASH complex subunit Dad2-domain-containing protein [Neurospora hispaniola]